MFSLGTLLILTVVIPKSYQACMDDCPLQFETLGCYKDAEIPNRRLPNYILNDRDSTIDNFSGQMIQWFKWEAYIRDFACRCAKKAQELGYDLFGLQFYGECWAGHSSTRMPKKLDSLPNGCVGDHYQPCNHLKRFCVGHQWQNMVYRIVKPACPVKFERMGCYKDRHNVKARPLPTYLMNDRDTTLKIFSGKLTDWRNWDLYVPDLACRCAKLANQKGLRYFGLQFYGECWTQAKGDDIGLYAREGVAESCTSNCNSYRKCMPFDKYCVGEHFTNAVYKIVQDGSCDVIIEEKGCYKEGASGSRLMPIEIRNEVNPLSKVFAGKLLKPSTWVNDFSRFLCNCAHTVREKGYRYFGISNIGECWSGPVSDQYASLGQTDQCYMGTENRSCVQGDKLCAGWNAQTNFVYEIKNPKRW